jgi:Tol biopolymer transport system component
MSSSETVGLAGKRLDPTEAVSIALELVAQVSSGAIEGLPADISAIRLLRGGRMVVDTRRLDQANPATLSRLLREFLTVGGEHPVPGALMLAIARASGTTEMSGFATLEEFAAALRRFAPDSHGTLSRLYERLAPPQVAAPAPSSKPPSPQVITPALAQQHWSEAAVIRPEMLSPSVATEHRRRRRRLSGFVRFAAMLVLLVAAAGAGWLIRAAYGPVWPFENAITVERSPAAPETAPASRPTPTTGERAERAADRVGTTGPVVSREAVKPAVVTPAPAIEGAYSPSFAPSGEAMYFHTGRTGEPSALGRSNEPSALGRSSEPLARSSGSPDTQLLRIVDDGSSNYHVRPSPDGKWIAFDSDREGVRGVFIGRADGSELRRVSGPGHAAVPSWSPDGRQLAMVKAEPDRERVWNVWLLDMSTGDLRRVTGFTQGQPWGASWFPDGRRIAYSHEDRLIIHDLETDSTRVFQSPRTGRLVRTPAVSPDGSRIIFQVFRDGVWMLDLGDGSARRVLTDPTAEEFAWDPQGRRVAFHSKRSGGWSIFITGPGR